MNSRTWIAGVLVGGLGFGAVQAQNAAFSPELLEVAGQLNMGGVYFSLTSMEDDILQGAEMLDSLVASVGQAGGELPPNLSVSDIVEALGLFDVRAHGQSAHREGVHWQNRSYVATGPKRSGLLSILGDKGSDFAAPKFAAPDADVVLETELNLGEVAKLMRGVAGGIGLEAKGAVDDYLSEVIPGGSLTAEVFLSMFKVRASIAATLVPDKRIPLQDGIDVPGVFFVARLDRAKWIWMNYREMIESDSKRVEKDGLVMLMAPEPLETPMGEIQPVIAYDEAKELLWVAMREADIAAARGDGPKLATSEGYQKAMKGLPAQGNALAFVSGRFTKEVMGLVGAFVENSPEEAQGFLSGIQDGLLSGDPQPYAGVISLQEKGLLFAANAPFPQKGGGMMSSTATIVALSAMATPAIFKALGRAELAQSVSNGRQLKLNLDLYAMDHDGAYPPDLKSVVPGGYLDEALFEQLMEVHKGQAEWVYRPGFENIDKPNNILLYSTPAVDGKFIVVHIDGSAMVRPEREMEALLEEEAE